jgi:hypothetical protein
MYAIDGRKKDQAFTYQYLNKSHPVNTESIIAFL